jgi:hypothetical protein
MTFPCSSLLALLRFRMDSGFRFTPLPFPPPKTVDS